MNDPAHPLWGLIRLSILMVAMVVVMRFTATNFDNTEIKSIITIFLTAAGAEGLSQLFRRKH